MLVSRIARCVLCIVYCEVRIVYCVLRGAYCVLCIPIKDIGTGLVLRNDRVSVSIFSKGFCLARETIPKYLRYYRYPISNLLIQYQQIAAGSRRAGTGLLISEDCAKVN